MPYSKHIIEIRDTEKHHVPGDDPEEDESSWIFKHVKYMLLRVKNDMDEDVTVSIRGSIVNGDEELEEFTYDGPLTSGLVVPEGESKVLEVSSRFRYVDLELECEVAPTSGEVTVWSRRGL